jgi:competence protein ComEC
VPRDPAFHPARLAGLLKLAQGGSTLMLPPLVLAAALLAGAARYQAYETAISAGSIARYNDAGPIRITGMVVQPPDERETATYLLVQVSQVAPSGGVSEVSRAHPASGLIGVQSSSLTYYQYGDVLQIDGEPTAPDSDTLTQTQGILSSVSFASISRLKSGQGNPIWSVLFKFKAHALSVVEQIFPPPESDLMAGILLGVASGIPADLQQAFKNSGTAHIIAISGYNISILSAVFYYVFTRLLGRWRGAAATAISIALYTLLVGAGASVLQAAIMAWIGLLGEQIGRRQAGANSLVFTGAIMCLVTPTFPLNISFQLTFMATLGLVLYATPLQAAFQKLAARFLPQTRVDRLAGPVGDYFLMTLAAQITTLPVMAYQFRSLSLVALIANPLVLPPQPLVEILGSVALVGGLIDLSLGRWLGYLA